MIPRGFVSIDKRAMKTIHTILAFCILAGCAPLPQYRGRLIIMNCTENPLSVQSNLICPNGNYPSDASIAPGKVLEIASSDNYPDAASVTMDKFFTNHNDAVITVSSTIDGIPMTRTWKYADRDNGQKQLFDLNDCSFESGEDFRNHYTYMNFIFMIHEEDLRKSP